MSLTLEDLRVKAVIAAGLVWLTVVCLAGILAVPRMRASLVDAAEEQLSIYAVSVSAEMSRGLRSAVRELESIATLPDLAERPIDSLTQTLREIERSSAFYDRLTLTDLDGRVVAGAAPEPRMVHYGRNQSSSVREPYRDDAGRAILDVTTPVRSSAGLHSHVLVGSVGLEDDRSTSLYEPIWQASVPDGWHVVVLGRERQVLADSKFVGAEPPRHESKRFRATSSIALTGWSVIVDAPEEVVLGGTDSIVSSFFIPVGLGTAAILLGAFVLAAGPTGALVQLADALVRYGRGQDPERVSVRGSGQIATAQRAFNQMVEERERTEAKLSERNERLRQASKMEAVGRLAGGVAHDFNNVLTVVLGYSDFVLNELGERDQTRQKLLTIRSAAERGADVTRRLLAFSRQQVASRRVIAVNDVVGEVAEMLRPLFGETIRLELATDAANSWVLADKGELSEVFVNLAMNARDAMPQGGILLIRTENRTVEVEDGELSPGPYVVVRVEDNGSGMDEEIRQRVFEPFFSTKEVGQGTGLGLSMVLGVVQECGGAVRVDSAPDRGTRFEIHLPSVGEPADEGAAETLELVEPERDATILVVEDEPVVLALAAEILEGEGYRVLTAGDPTVALETAASSRHAIDLVITDVVMPGMSGRELASRLRRERQELKVIFVSGYTDGELGHDEEGSGPQHFVPKPFARADLLREVRAAVHGSGRIATLRNPNAKRS